RERGAARGVDGYLGPRARLAPWQGRADGRRGGGRRGRKPVVHAPGWFRPGAAAGRASGLGAERRLARRVPERDGGGGGAAPNRRGGPAARDGAARQLGRRGGRALRALALRIERGG